MDDEEPIRQLIKIALGMKRHEVVCTEDGEAFLAAHAAVQGQPGRVPSISRCST